MQPGYIDYQTILPLEGKEKRSLEENPTNKMNLDVNINVNNEEKKLDVII
jgi:hypothetical protein